MTIEPETFPTLDAADVALIAELGVRRRVSEGEYLYREGDVTYDFFVLVSAEVDIVVTVDGGESSSLITDPVGFSASSTC